MPTGVYERKSLTERFWEKLVAGDEDACWLWLGSCNPYGILHMSVDEGNELAHRASWRMHNGTIPDGMNVLHTCDNPPCCNPKHLFLGTQAANMHDCSLKQRNPGGRFIPREVRESAIVLLADRSVATVAQILGVSTKTIFNWKRRGLV